VSLSNDGRLFPFIVGCGRSGTTLLTSMLDSHPALAFPGESGFLVEVCGRESSGRFDAIDVESVLDELRRFDRFDAWGLDASALQAAVARSSPRCPADVIRALYLFFASTRNKMWGGDKTPDHVMLIPELHGLFPEAQFIHVIRDGRDVALASRGVSWAPDSIEELALYWAKRVRCGRAAGRLLGPASYLEVRYEDLVENPDGELRRVTEFLELPFSSAMLDFSAAAERQRSMSPDAVADKSLSRPLTKGLRDWRRDMAPADALTFTILSGPLLRRLGYDVRVKGASQREYLSGAGRSARLLSRRVINRALRGVQARFDGGGGRS